MEVNCPGFDLARRVTSPVASSYPPSALEMKEPEIGTSSGPRDRAVTVFHIAIAPPDEYRVEVGSE
jgi:hypothetical protein